MIFTSLLRLPSRMPLKGWGKGVGTGPPGDGIMMIWVSTPTIWSPCLAAGWPMSVQLHRGALDLDAAIGLDIHPRSGLERHAAIGLEVHIRLGFDLDLALRGELDIAVQLDRQLVVLRINEDLIVAGLVDDLDARRVVRVVKDDRMAGASFEMRCTTAPEPLTALST